MNKSFLKWAGGKSKALPEIMPILDNIIKECQISRFVEPFLGSGVVSLNIQGVDSFLINDFNKDLMNMFKFLLDKKSFINDLESFFNPKNNDPFYYKEMVSRFNGSSDSYIRALIFLYLNKHCFNGLMRYNKYGEFNTPFGTYNSITFPSKLLEIYKSKLENNLFEIRTDSYQMIFEDIRKGDLIYCDPPCLNFKKVKTSSVCGEKEFTSEDQIYLVKLAEDAVKKGAVVVISNYNTLNAESLYSTASFKKIFNVNKAVSSIGSKRKAMSEILVVYK